MIVINEVVDQLFDHNDERAVRLASHSSGDHQQQIATVTKF